MDSSKPGIAVLDCLQSLLKFEQICSIELMMPYNHLILCHPLLLLPSLFLSFRVFSSESALPIRWPKYWSFSFSISPMDIQGQFPLELTGLIPCCPRDSQEFSPTPQFESINSSMLSLLYGPTFTFVHDYWKNHSFD